MADPQRGLRLVRRLLIAVGFLLPTLTLIPFGWLWLWQNGHVLPWVIALLVSTALAFAGQAWVTRRIAASDPPAAGKGAPAPIAGAGTPRELAAAAAVSEIARATEPETLTSQDAVLALGVRTIEAVAAHMHPGEADPIWNFTLPEALVLLETTAARLRPLIVDNVPFGDRISVAQALRIYQWRGAIDVVEKGYDLWRIVRLANPLTALTNEARERMTKALYAGIKEQMSRRLVTLYVEEVGRAAIDLYSGRLRIVGGGAGLAAAPAGGAPSFAGSPTVLAPVRLLVAGQISAGKSSLVNALLERTAAKVDVLPATAGFTAYELEREGIAEALLIDSAGVGPDALEQAALAEAAFESDLVLWVAAANRADRDVDLRTLDQLRARYQARVDRRPPPILLILTHIDRLRPFQDWAPPYDIANPTTPKAQSIRAAMAAASQDLAIALTDTVPVCLDARVGTSNVDLVWSRIAAALPDAESARLVRLVAEVEGRGHWRTALTQAVNAGRLIGGVVVKALRDGMK